jgi:hypothetical protein
VNAKPVATFVVLFLACTACERETSAFPLTVETLRTLNPENTAGISYEVDDDVVFVTVTDKYLDAHIHRLFLGNLTRTQAIELLKQKQLELEQRK